MTERAEEEPEPDEPEPDEEPGSAPSVASMVTVGGSGSREYDYRTELLTVAELTDGTTLAEKLVSRMNAKQPDCAALLPMDGYHYDDTLLEELGRYSRKGAPDTFDAGGLEHILQRLVARNEAAVAVPVFDRSIEIARAGARLIPQSVGVIIVEGNYLLLEADPWANLKQHFDISVLVDVPETVLRARLIRRWQSFALPPDVVEAKVEGNDLPNGRKVSAHSSRPDYRIGGV